MGIPTATYLERKNRVSISRRGCLFFFGENINTFMKLSDIDTVYNCSLGFGIRLSECFYILCGKNGGVVVPDYVSVSDDFDLHFDGIPVTKVVMGRLPYRMWRRVFGIIPTGVPRFALYSRSEIDHLLSRCCHQPQECLA